MGKPSKDLGDLVVGVAALAHRLRSSVAIVRAASASLYRGITTNVGTVLPPPAVTLRSAAVESRVNIPSI